MDCGEGVSETAGSVSENGRAAGRNMILGEKNQKSSEEIIQAVQGVEIFEPIGELGSEIGDVALFLGGRKVFAADVGERGGHGLTTEPAFGKEMRTEGL
jgi:hypothetical protein